MKRALLIACMLGVFGCGWWARSSKEEIWPPLREAREYQRQAIHWAGEWLACSIELNECGCIKRDVVPSEYR